MNLQSQVVRKPDPLSSQVDEDLVIFSAENGMYYGTEEVGKRIWSLIETQTTVKSLCDTLMQEFEVDRETCEREVVAFLDQLNQEGLIITR
jgi:hypothetical protein